MQHGPIRNNMKKIKHEKSMLGASRKKVQYQMSAIRKKVQFEKNATQKNVSRGKRWNMKNVQHVKSATRKKSSSK